MPHSLERLIVVGVKHSTMLQPCDFVRWMTLAKPNQVTQRYMLDQIGAVVEVVTKHPEDGSDAAPV